MVQDTPTDRQSRYYSEPPVATHVQFAQIDKIVSLEPGASIQALKMVSLSSEYLQDHFPLFPVLPGVLMLESLYQAGAWLVRVTDDFRQAMVLLKEARSVKYGNFVKPGQTLRVEAQIQKHEASLTTLKSQAFVEGELAVSARIVLERFNLADRNPEFAVRDEIIRRDLKQQLALLWPGEAGAPPAPNVRVPECSLAAVW